MKTLRVVINLSEGKNLESIEQFKNEVLINDDVELVDTNSDRDHNRTVFVYEGEPNNVLEATKRLSLKALELIDMRNHKGGHPRLGAVDVIPFLPMENMTLEEAVEIAKEYGKFLGSLGIPVYYSSGAATSPERKSASYIRKGEYEALADRILLEEFMPDEGPQEFVAKSGASIVGARFPVVALNVNLKTDNLQIGKDIVKNIREKTGGFQGVRAIALEIPDKKLIQVSVMLDEYKKTPIHRVFETIKSEAKQYGVLVESTELVGGTPLDALEDVIRFYLQAHNFSIKDIC